MQTLRSQRWRERRELWVPNATVIDPSQYSVDVLGKHAAVVAFIREHHYAGDVGPVRLATGLFRNGRGGTSQLVGVAAFTVPINSASVRRSAGLADPLAACDLGRFVLLDEVAGNGESYFLARSMRLLRREKQGIITVLSYADPVRRMDSYGAVIMPGHVGGIYRGARYIGRSSKRTDLALPSGRILSPRTVSKLRNGERGAEAAERRILDAGAPRRAALQEYASWLSDLEAQGFLTRRRHPGCHIFQFPLTRAARRSAATVPALEPPQLDRSILVGDVTALPLLTSVC